MGYKTAGFAGSFAATVGVSLPSFLIIYAVSFILRQFENFAAVQYAFTGIRAAVLALVVNALVTMFRACPKGWLSYILMVFAFAVTAFLDVNVIYVILICAAAGLAVSLVEKSGVVTARHTEGAREKGEAAAPESPRGGADTDENKEQEGNRS